MFGYLRGCPDGLGWPIPGLEHDSLWDCLDAFRIWIVENDYDPRAEPFVEIPDDVTGHMNWLARRCREELVEADDASQTATLHLATGVFAAAWTALAVPGNAVVEYGPDLRLEADAMEARLLGLDFVRREEFSNALKQCFLRTYVRPGDLEIASLRRRGATHLIGTNTAVWEMGRDRGEWQWIGSRTYDHKRPWTVERTTNTFLYSLYLLKITDYAAWLQGHQFFARHVILLRDKPSLIRCEVDAAIIVQALHGWFLWMPSDGRAVWCRTAAHALYLHSEKERALWDTLLPPRY